MKFVLQNKFWKNTFESDLWDKNNLHMEPKDLLPGINEAGIWGKIYSQYDLPEAWEMKILSIVQSLTHFCLDSNHSLWCVIFYSSQIQKLKYSKPK